MKEYFYNIVKEYLKQDIIKELLKKGFDEKIVNNIVEDYFLNNDISFKDREYQSNSKTHQVRDRRAYTTKEAMCKALVWNEGYGGQCSRSSKENCDGFCKTHFNKGGNDWWLGTIEKRVERPVDKYGKIHLWLENR
jgi:hypothetical protein